MLQPVPDPTSPSTVAASFPLNDGILGGIRVHTSDQKTYTLDEDLARRMPSVMRQLQEYTRVRAGSHAAGSPYNLDISLSSIHSDEFNVITEYYAYHNAHPQACMDMGNGSYAYFASSGNLDQARLVPPQTGSQTLPNLPDKPKDPPVPFVLDPPHQNPLNVCAWDRAFLTKYTQADANQKLFELILATHTLGCTELQDAASKIVAEIVSGLSPAEIRSKFNLPDDLNKADKAEIEREALWCNSKR